MSDRTIIGGVVGAAVGFIVAGPGGALYGAAIGAGLGAYSSLPEAPTQKGPRLADTSIQTSTYGTKIPRGRGSVAIYGNLLWLENNKLKEKVKKEETGGKGGGGGQTVETYSYSATFAIGLCNGPIVGIRKIWCGDKLIYNISSTDIDTIIASNKMAKGITIYRGTDDQEPNFRYQADVGVNNAPAFRGRAYVVFYDFNLKDFGNTLQAAQFKFEVVFDQPSASTNVVLSDEFENVNTYSTRMACYDGAGYVYVGQNASAGPAQVYYVYKVVGKRVTFHRSFITNGGGIPGGTSDTHGCLLNLDPVLGQLYWLDEMTQTLTIISPGADYVGEQARFVKFDEYIVMSGYVGTTTTIIKIDLSTGSTVATLVMGDYIQSMAYYGGYIYAIRYLTSEIYVIDADAFTLADTWTVPISGFGQGNIAASETGVYVTRQSEGAIYRVSDGFAVKTHDGLLYAGSAGIGPLHIFGTLALVLAPEIVNGPIVVAYANPIDDDPGVPLSDVITTECALSGVISASDIDVSELTATVKGFRVADGTIRAALEQLQIAYPFDVIPSGYKIKFVPRGGSSVRTFSIDDLGAGESEQDRFKTTREMETQLPWKTTVKYLDKFRDYDINQQEYSRINTQASSVNDIELAVVLSANEAAGICEVLTSVSWAQRNSHEFQLSPENLDIETADIVTIVGENSTHEVLIIEANYQTNGVINCRAVSNSSAVYYSGAEGQEAAGSDPVIPLPGGSIAVLLDIPVVDETYQNTPGYVAAVVGDSNTWPGAILIRSTDGGQTWADVQAFTSSGSVGSTINSLSANPGTLIDESVLTVEMIDGVPVGVTEEQMLAGTNYAAYGVDGRWEIIRFRDATLVEGNTYQLQGFKRGEFGTEWATGLHGNYEYFVLLADPDNAFVGAQIANIGNPQKISAVTVGETLEESIQYDFTYNGVNLMPLSPVYASATRDVSSNLSATFTRRSRLSSTWWTTGTTAPVGEESLLFSVDVMDGSDVVRTIEATTTAFDYSAADQTADFGSPQSSITFKIYQISAIVGRGYPLEVTL